MKLTNKYNLPQAFLRAALNDPYDRGEADFSVTELLNPPRAQALKLTHKDELEEDCSDRVFAILGQSVHKILERAARVEDLVERRVYGMFGEHMLTGQIDLLERDRKVLSDWKVTKAYPFTKKGGKGQKPEWIAQLNMQLELLRMNELDADKLQIVGIIKDWTEACTDPYNKMKYMEGYPPAEIVTIDIPMWPREKTQGFIRERMKAHLDARKALPECTPAETWGSNRCRSYCSVSKFCLQYQTSLKTGLTKEVV